MSSKIEWTDETLNFILARYLETGKIGYHCEKISPACAHCYACAHNGRCLPSGGTGLDYVPASRDKVEIFLDEDVLAKPNHWKRPRKIFPCSMTDLFADFVPDAFIWKLWMQMAATQRHTYQIVTKRPERMASMSYALYKQFGPLPNVWLGVTVENQEYADKRIPFLVDCAADVRFVSYEPALGPVSFLEWINPEYSHPPMLDWIIAGGESGNSARPSHPQWFRSVRDECASAGVPFFFKQWGAWKPTGSGNIAIPSAIEEGLNRVSMMADGTICIREHGLSRAQRSIDPAGAAALDRWHAWGNTVEKTYPYGPPRGVTIVDPFGYQWMVRVGKKKAGRTLDGHEWSQFPKVEVASCTA